MGLGMTWVSGRTRVPLPAARIIAFMLASVEICPGVYRLAAILAMQGGELSASVIDPRGDF